MRDPHKELPVNPLPPVVWMLVLPVVAMELVLSAAGAGLVGGPTGIGWRNDALQRFALSPQMLDQMIETGRWTSDFLMRFVTYAFVHASFTHALFVTVFILALGKMVAEVFNWLAVLAVFLLATIAGGVAYSFLPDVRLGLIGGYPGVYGLIGAFTFILWARLGAENANRYRAFTLIGFLLGIQLLFALIFGGGWDWVADIAGFCAGFLLSFVVGPGGPTHLIGLIRQR